MKKIIAIFTLSMLQSCCYVSLVPPYAKKGMIDYSVQVISKFKNEKGKNVTVKASGFAIDKDHILTAGHFCVTAIDGGFPPKIFIIKKRNYTDKEERTLIEEVVWISDIMTDLCVLKKRRHKLKILPIKTKDVKIGDKVMTIGGPDGHFPVRTYGEIIGLSMKELYKEKVFLSSIKVIPGNSGGMVVNEQGFIIGMAVAYLAETPSISIIIKMSEICKELKNADLKCR